jgi:putative ABC transport system ATP-binding protein
VNAEARLDTTPLLELSGVTRLVGRGPVPEPLLKDVSLAIYRCDFVVVWGRARSGKTTLLRIASGLERPDAGVVRVAGEDLGAMSPTARGAVRLGPIGVAGTDGAEAGELRVLDYLALPIAHRVGRRRALKEARETLRRLDVGHAADATWESLGDLDRAHVSLAHAVARRPRLLLVDDLTKNLDPLEEADFLTRLSRLAQEIGAAVLLVSSALPTAAFAHETYLISGGTLRPLEDAQQRVARLHEEGRR